MMVVANALIVGDLAVVAAAPAWLGERVVTHDAHGARRLAVGHSGASSSDGRSESIVELRGVPNTTFIC
jgi:hypothetical protein